MISHPKRPLTLTALGHSVSRSPTSLLTLPGFHCELQMTGKGNVPTRIYRSPKAGPLSLPSVPLIAAWAKGPEFSLGGAVGFTMSWPSCPFPCAVPRAQHAPPWKSRISPSPPFSPCSPVTLDHPSQTSLPLQSLSSHDFSP